MPLSWAPILPRMQQVGGGNSPTRSKNSGLGDEYGRMINEQAMKLMNVKKIELQEREATSIDSQLAVIKRQQN